MKIFSVSRPLRFASGPLLLLALNGGGFPPQQASQPPQYIEKSYPVPAGNELPDKNAQMQMHEKEASRKDFEAANAERRRQIGRDSEELVRLAKELKATLENTEEGVAPRDAVRKAELIERLAHGVKEKMKLTVSRR